MPRAKPKQPYDKKKNKSGLFKILIFCQIKQHDKCPGFFEYYTGNKNYPTSKRSCKCACHGKTVRKHYY